MRSAFGPQEPPIRDAPVGTFPSFTYRLCVAVLYAAAWSPFLAFVKRSPSSRKH
ncbi:hypothetical protein OH77DRAFT_1424781 [Trametes cingulata]|nr:hypothetical protein OH77DRAFT_1424781 [Trametes cingulata]